MNADLCRVLVIVGYILMISMPTAAETDGFRHDLDALWRDTNPVTRANCLHEQNSAGPFNF